MITDAEIEFVLMNIDAIKKAVMEKRLDSGAGGTTGGNGSGHSRISDPTAFKALHELAPLNCVFVSYGPSIAGVQDVRCVRNPEKWLKVAAYVEKYYKNNTSMKNFYASRYIECEEWRSTIKKMHITRGLYYAMKNDVLCFAMQTAVGVGLMTPHSRIIEHNKKQNLYK